MDMYEFMGETNCPLDLLISCNNRSGTLTLIRICWVLSPEQLLHLQDV